jgi:hypothetical protein
MEEGVSSREELLSRELVRCGSPLFCPNGLKSRFAKRLEDAFVREAVSVTVAVEVTGGTVRLARLGEGGDDTQARVVCTYAEDGPEALVMGSFFGDTILSSSRRGAEIDV